MADVQDGAQHKKEGSDYTITVPLDNQMIERFKACKEAQFPICLDHAVTKIFGNKELMLSVAEKAGFKATNVSSTQDVWDLYLRLGNSWEKKLGNSVTAVIEFQSLKEMESMGCTKCPLYEMELEKKNKNYAP
ncbi:MAG: hypothetical protein M1378_11715 [Bacteroidetes bacterium]|nr:hypothetical protein [Bacteroidota bacterium]